MLLFQKIFDKNVNFFPSQASIIAMMRPNLASIAATDGSPSFKALFWEKEGEEWGEE